MTIGAFTPYDVYQLRAQRQEFDFLGGTIRAALLTNAYVPDVAAHATWGDVSAHEVTDPDYVKQTLGGKTIALDGSGRPVMDADDIDFGDPVTITAKYLVTYLDAASAYLMGHVDLNVGAGSLVVAAGPLVIAINAAGLYRIDPRA